MTIVSQPGWLHTWSVEDVKDVHGFAEYARQMIGTPDPTYKDITVARAKAADLFKKYPGLTWRSLCRIVDWEKTRGNRPPRIWMIIDNFRSAWSAGVLPELDPRNEEDPEVERLIEAALQIEQDSYWRKRLVGSRGVDARRDTLSEWLGA